MPWCARARKTRRSPCTVACSRSTTRTRVRTETTAISADEDETFREALAEFKRALDQNLPVEDHQTHYDLGVAFMEMGLLNEAISEFQKALRSPVGRLRTSEALGQAFF